MVSSGPSLLASSPLRRWVLTWLLPVALLLSQQGGLLHELGHLRASLRETTTHLSSPRATTAEVSSPRSPAGVDTCLACVAYAQVAGLALFALPVAPPPAGLRFHFAPGAGHRAAEAAPPARRNRDPPRLA